MMANESRGYLMIRAVLGTKVTIRNILPSLQVNYTNNLSYRDVVGRVDDDSCF